MVEDVGRHNTIDKLLGLLPGRMTSPPQDQILLSTGRISSEMLNKAGACGRASRRPPHLADEFIARTARGAWHVTLVGYVRRDSLNVYTDTHASSRRRGAPMHTCNEAWTTLDRNFKEFMDCLGQFTEDELTSVPAAGKWTVKEVVAHVWSLAPMKRSTPRQAWHGPGPWQKGA